MYEIERVVSVAWAALVILGEILLCDGMSGKGTGSLLTVPATWILAGLRACAHAGCADGAAVFAVATTCPMAVPA